MKKFLSLLVLAGLLFTLCSCKAKGDDLKFYVIKNEDMVKNAGADAMLHTAKTKGRLAFCANDLEGWLWAEHTVRLKEVKVKGSAAGGGSVLFQTKKEDFFLVTLKGRILMTGTFDPTAGGVYITDQGDRDFALGFYDPFSEHQDSRANQKLYDYLTQMQLLVSELKDQ